MVVLKLVSKLSNRRKIIVIYVGDTDVTLVRRLRCATFFDVRLCRFVGVGLSVDYRTKNVFRERKLDASVSRDALSNRFVVNVDRAVFLDALFLFHGFGHSRSGWRSRGRSGSFELLSTLLGTDLNFRSRFDDLVADEVGKECTGGLAAAAAAAAGMTVSNLFLFLFENRFFNF